MTRNKMLLLLLTSSAHNNTKSNCKYQKDLGSFALKRKRRDFIMSEAAVDVPMEDSGAKVST